MHLLQAFQDFIANEQLFAPRDRLLLAVSGGLDSVVLCELCHQAGLQFQLAHCNFQLRGAESNRDEAFVLELARRYGSEWITTRFDTAEYARTHRLSIQVAARELRYEWFDNLTGGEGQPAVIVTAHHLDDNIETLIMNFFKGTGIAGLRAMLPRQGKIVRPLLFARREDIRQFAAGNDLGWVEDSSNETDNYTRNFFRHRILPLIDEAYPAALQNLAANLDRFRGIEMLYEQALQRHKKKLLEYRGGEIHIAVQRLKRTQPLPTLTYEIFSPYGFTPQQTGAIIALMESPTGKYVASPTHRILRNRNWLILSPLHGDAAATMLIEAGENAVDFDGGCLHIQKAAPAWPPPADQSVAWLDAKEIAFPLILRPWRPGDYFYPLGMRKKKKLARFFIDQKLSATEKEKVWVLEMNKKIIWVVGLRIDDRFKITSATREVLKVTIRSADAPAH